MKRAFIVHGWKGRPDSNWKPWLKRELNSQGIQTEILPMPNPDHPEREEWVKAITAAVGTPDADTILIGHSLGCISILLYLQSLADNQKIRGAVLVAGFASRPHNGHPSFFDEPLRWDVIRAHCDKFVAIHSDNDPNVDISNLETFKDKLHAKPALMHNMGHFGSADGCFDLPVALQEILAL